MSVKTYTESTTRIITKTIEEHVWEIHYDAMRLAVKAMQGKATEE